MLTGFRERISHDVVNLLAAPEYKKLQADPPLLAYSQYSHAQSHMRPRITTRTTRTAARMRSTAHDRTHARTHARMRIHSCMRARKRTLTDAPCARSLAYGQPKRAGLVGDAGSSRQGGVCQVGLCAEHDGVGRCVGISGLYSQRVLCALARHIGPYYTTMPSA